MVIDSDPVVARPSALVALFIAGAVSALLAGGPAAAEPGAAVLGPEAAATARALLGPSTEPLTEGWTVESWRVERTRLVVVVDHDGTPLELQVMNTAPAAAAGEHHSGSGDVWVVGSEAVPISVLAAVAERLTADPARRLAWRPPTAAAETETKPETTLPTRDPARAALERRTLDARRASRGGAGAALDALLDPRVSQALSRLGTGDAETAQRLCEALLDPPELAPPGAWSVWAASVGHEAAGDAMAASELYPWEPRAYALLARRARQEGRFDDAARWAAIALDLPLTDDLALVEAQALGWPVATALEGTVPLGEDAETPSWPWTLAGLWGAALVLFVAVLRREDRVMIAGLAAVLAAWLLVPERPRPVPPRLPVELELPLAGGPCAATAGQLRRHGLDVHVRCGAVTTTLTASPREAGSHGLHDTAHHVIGVRGDAAAASLEVLASAKLLADAVTVAEGVGFRAQPSTPTPMASSLGWPAWSTASDIERAELRFGAGLAGGALVMVLAMLLDLFRRPLRKGDATVLAAAVAVAVAAHALAPGRMLMVYGGYDLTAHLIDGRIPRYGVGAVWTYGPWLWLLGPDHVWILMANRVLGVLCLVAAWDLGRALWTGKRAVAWVTAALLVTLPVIWRGDTSESIVVAPTLLFLFGMRALVADRPAAAAWLLLTASLGRPEMLVMAGLVPIWWWAGGVRRDGREVMLAVAGSVWFAVVARRTWMTATTMSAADALPALGEGPLSNAVRGVTSSIILDPTFAPPLLVVLIAVGALTKGRLARATLVFGVTWLAVTGVDLVPVSVPRLQLPALLLLVPVAGLGAVSMWERLGRWRRPALGLAAVVWLAGAGYSGWTLFQPINEDAEEALWRDAVAALPTDARCLATVGWSDPPQVAKTPRHRPSYLFRASHPGLSHVDLVDLVGDADRDRPADGSCATGRYALLGTRCYTTMRQPGEPAPVGAAPLEICERVRATPGVAPLIQRDVVNHGDLAYPMYPAGGPLALGLYALPDLETR